MSPAGSKNAPEAKARENIDALLAQAGWLVQDRDKMNLTAGDAIAVREFKLETAAAMSTTSSSSMPMPLASWRQARRLLVHKRRGPN
jgi:hypothetical protein